jgi:hypothetical protein
VTLEEARQSPGRQVIYRDRRGHRTVIEVGSISSVNDHYVFVQFKDQPNAQACPPEALELVPPELAS